MPDVRYSIHSVRPVCGHNILVSRFARSGRPPGGFRSMGRNRRVLEQVINFNSYNAGIRGCSLTLTFVDRSDRRDLNAIRGRLYGPDWGAFP